MIVTETKVYIPEYMQSQKNWVLWRKADRNGKTQKLPVSPLDYSMKHIGDPERWTDFHTAVSALCAANQRQEKFAGLGFELSGSGLIFVDLDHCVSNGKPNEMASDFLDTLKNSYCELSQSGTGLHFFIRGSIPYMHTIKRHDVEFYYQGRFCACTFDAVHPCEPAEADQNVIDLLARWGVDFERLEREEERERFQAARASAPWLSTGSKLTDSQVIYHIRKTRYGALYDTGMTPAYGSQSEADLALCTALCFWCDNDIDQVDRLFRSSALYRSKWDRRDYSARTLEKAAASNGITYSEWIKKRTLENLRYWNRPTDEIRRKK